MQHRIEPSKETTPFELADEHSLPIETAQLKFPRNEHRIEPDTSDDTPIELASDDKKISAPTIRDVQELVAALSQLNEGSQIQDIASKLRTGIQLVHSLEQEKSKISQKAILERRSYDVLKEFAPILKNSVTSPLKLLEILASLGQKHLQSHTIASHASTDTQYFDSIRLAIILACGAGLKDADIASAGGIAEERTRSTLLSKAETKPVIQRRSQEEKDAERERKKARLKGEQAPAISNQGDEQDSEETPLAHKDNDLTAEIIQKETSVAKKHLQRAKSIQAHFAPIASSLTSQLSAIRRSNPILYQDKVYTLASQAVEWLQAEVASAHTKLLHDPSELKQRAQTSEAQESEINKQIAALNAALKPPASILKNQDKIAEAAADISYELQQLLKVARVGIQHLETGISGQVIAQARAERRIQEENRLRGLDPRRLDRFRRDGEEPRIGGV